MKKYTPILLCLILICILPCTGQAQENSGKFSGGSVIIGFDNRSCSGSLEGAMRYNSSSGIEFCNGTSWTSAGGGGGCTAPASCPNVGDVCSDGSLFAGFVVYNNSSCEALYVTDNNQSAGSQWKTATGTNDINPDIFVDGKVNITNRGSGTFPAFNLCESNTYHGKSDWYLPAQAELHLLWLNRAAIDANAAGNFATQYWSSTEYDNSNAWYVYFTGGWISYTIKTNSSSMSVRCVRRN